MARKRKISRRSFLASTGGGVLLAGIGMAAPPLARAATESAKPTPVRRLSIRLRVNGKSHSVTVDAGRTLADVLREDIGLTGVKVGCNRGQCGACTVLVYGRPVNSCSLFAFLADGAAITTIESFSDGQTLAPLQQAFVDHNAVQCGFCAPGMICAAKGLLNSRPQADEDQIREGLSGNLCRCGVYANAVKAVRSVVTGSGRSG